MATRAELIFNIKELLKEHTDDSLIIDEQVLFQIKSFRALFIRQLYSDRAKEFDQSATQSFCMDMEKVDAGLCGVNTNCYVLRSTKKIPDLLSIKGRSTLISVGPPIIGMEPHELVDYTEVNSCMDDPYSSTAAFVQDGYIYIVGKEPSFILIKCVNVTGIFDDPDLLEEFELCETCGTTSTSSCYDEEASFPVPGHLIPLITEEVMKGYLRTEKLEDHRDVDNNSVPT